MQAEEEEELHQGWFQQVSPATLAILHTNLHILTCNNNNNNNSSMLPKRDNIFDSSHPLALMGACPSR